VLAVGYDAGTYWDIPHPFKVRGGKARYSLALIEYSLDFADLGKIAQVFQDRPPEGELVE
jgi:hypothetical protein